MRTNKVWTKKEDEYLKEVAGCLSVATIARNLQRSNSAVANRIFVKGLSIYKKGDYLTGNEVAKMLGLIDIRPLVKQGLPLKKKKFYKCSYNVIKPEKLMKWLEENQEKWNAGLTERLGLPTEPLWLVRKRKEDSEKANTRKKWEKADEKRLINLYNAGFSFEEMAEKLQRTEKAIRRKVSRLKENHEIGKKKINIRWKDNEINMMLELEKQGLTDKEIAYELGREREHIVDKRRRLVRDGKTKKKLQRDAS